MCANQAKKSSLVSGNQPGKNVSSLTHPHSRTCFRIYISNFKKTKARQKAKETKEEKRISVEKITGYSDIVCEFALCTF